jgi:chemotaxis protein MotB
MRRALAPLALGLASCVSNASYQAEVQQRKAVEAELAHRDEYLEGLERRLRDAQQKGESLEAQRGALASERLQLLEELESRRTGNEQLREVLAEQQRVRDEREAQLEAVSAELTKALQREIAGGQIELQRLNARLRVRALAGLLFAPGAAELRPEGRAFVQHVAATLRRFPDYRVIVEGHTDAQPISTAAFPSNWELSSARAARVARLLADSGVHPARLSAAGFAEWQPIADNDDAAGRARNRRIEVSIVPPWAQ